MIAAEDVLLTIASHAWPKLIFASEHSCCRLQCAWMTLMQSTPGSGMLLGFTAWIMTLPYSLKYCMMLHAGAA